MHSGDRAVTARLGAAILGCAGTALSAEERAFFRGANPFGFILFDRNIASAGQLRSLTASLREAVGRDAPVFIDQEGGRVQRLRPPLARSWTPPLDFVADYGALALRAMYLRYRIIAAELRGYGIDGNCAPTLDVARPTTHAVLRNRCYGSSLGTVVAVGRAVAQALLDGGVLPVIKHMPGHGLAEIDSHLDLPRVTAGRETLESLDFAAFRPFADMPLGMTAHLVFDAYDTRPATISTRMISYIRGSLGFDGLLMTDDISMQALSGTVAQRGASALAAGCDVVLHCNGDLAEMTDLMDRAGAMSDAAQQRAEAALARRVTPPDVDIAALAADLEALSNQRGNERRPV